MDAKKSLLILAGATVTLLLALAAFNYTVDPQCYYHCDTVDVNRRTLNSYYQVAQRILAHPDAEIIILGSSRGQTTPPLWVQGIAGAKTLNLSAPGAELTTKLAFLKIAEENTKVRKVIWLADYFELIGETADAKIKNTPALKHFFDDGGDSFFSDTLTLLKGLWDHNNLEASIHFLKNRGLLETSQGVGTEIDYHLCQSQAYQGKETAASLKKEVNLVYQIYVNGVISPPQNIEAWKRFSTTIRSTAEKNIEVTIVVPPYHPDFLSRLKSEHPNIYQRHIQWIENIKTLSDSRIYVLDAFKDLRGLDASPSNWNDGVHFTCRAAMIMLKSIVTGWK